MKINLTCLLAVAGVLVGCGEKIAQPLRGTYRASTTTNAVPVISSFELALTSDERILFQGRTVPLEKLADTLRAAGVPPAKVSIRAESNVPFRLLLRVLQAVRPPAESLPDPTDYPLRDA